MPRSKADRRVHRVTTLVRVVASPATVGLFALAIAAPQSHAQSNEPVQVILDMDAQTPGIQSTVKLRACETVLPGVAVYIRDPLAARSFYSIGYLGGIDRGIALGHSPTNNVGAVTSINATPVSTANPGNTAYITPGFIPAFAGPEVWYMEYGVNAPAVIAADPQPIFTADIVLNATHPGDTFRFYLLDYVSVWSGNRFGAFSTTSPINALDTGGDASLDGTVTSVGVDPDHAVPVPPAAFHVDFIDGPGGARIEIIPRLGDVNADNNVNIIDLLAVVSAWGSCTPPPVCLADQNGDGQVNIIDLLIIVNHWGPCSNKT